MTDLPLERIEELERWADNTPTTLTRTELLALCRMARGYVEARPALEMALGISTAAVQLLPAIRACDVDQTNLWMSVIRAADEEFCESVKTLLARFGGTP